MAAIAPHRRRRSRRKKPSAGRRASTGPPAPTDGWWGNGPAPEARWPGVTIAIAAKWVPARERWESPDGRYYFDAAEAVRACDFFPAYLRHHIGEFSGDRFTLLDYQRLLLTMPLFGWKRATNGLRRFRKVFAFLPKGAGKSPWGAGTSLYLTLCDNEPAAEVYVVAGDKDQARTVHENAKIMVEKSEEFEESSSLADMCEVLKDSIYCPATRSTCKVISSDAATKHGFRPHGVIFDEFHAQRHRDLYEALKKSMVKRRQPVMVLMSHAGHDDEGICYEEYEYAKGVLSGTNPDENCLPVIFESTPTDNWSDPVVWRRVNPGHGITVQADGIASECEEAKAEPRKLNDFLMFHLNRWVNQASAWIPVDWWDACNGAVPTDDELHEWPCAVGIDMAQKIDLASAVAVFKLPLEEDREEHIEVLSEDTSGEIVKRTLSLNYRIAIVPAFWLPEDTLRERVRQDRVPYDLWAREKLLNVVDGAIVGADPIVNYLAGTPSKPGLVARFPRLKSAEFAFDPAFATDVALGLRDEHGLTVVEVLQNYKHLSESCQVFEALVKAKRVLHGGHRLLRWNLENVAIKRDDAGRIRPVKPRKATKRIDGIVAILLALTRLMALPLVKKRPKRKGALLYTRSGFVPAIPPSTRPDTEVRP